MHAKKILVAAVTFLILIQCHAAMAASASTTLGAVSVGVAKPSVLYIPKIGKDIPVIPVGLTSSGAIGVPHNFVQAGWYKYGAVPGGIGSAVIDGHVDNGANIAGVFKDLHELSIGDDIYVANASGNLLHFKVIDMSVYNRTASAAPVLADNGLPLLKIITCYGRFLPAVGTYDRRLVVTATLV